MITNKIEYRKKYLYNKKKKKLQVKRSKFFDMYLVIELSLLV